MKLHLCCGDVYLLGYENCDITGTTVKSPPPSATTLNNYYRERTIGNKQKTNIDKRINILNFPWPWESNSVDELVMIQAIEHFTPKDAVLIVSEAKRILRIGGVFLVDFPDIETTVKQYIDYNPNFCMRHIYCNHKNKYSIHHWGYTKNTFLVLLGGGWSVELKDIVQHDYPVIGCEATKL